MFKRFRKKIEFRLENPDELRALILRGDIDFVWSFLQNVAANLHNKDVDLKL